MRTSFKNSRAKMICIARHLFICFCIARDLFTCFCIARHLFTCVCIARHLFPRFCMQVPCSHASACCVHKRKLGSCKTRVLSSDTGRYTVIEQSASSDGCHPACTSKLATALHSLAQCQATSQLQQPKFMSHFTCTLVLPLLLL